MTGEQLDDLLRDVDPRTLAGAGVALLVIGILAGMLYGIKPAYAEYQDLNRKLGGELAGVARGSDVDTGLVIASLEADVETLQDKLYGGAAAVPRRELEAFVVDALDRISERHGVKLLGIIPAASNPVWLFEELPYAVKVEGSYFSVHRWLYDVEADLRPMVVKQFQLSPTRGGEAVIVDLSIVAYRASQGETP